MTKIILQSRTKKDPRASPDRTSTNTLILPPFLAVRNVQMQKNVKYHSYPGSIIGIRGFQHNFTRICKPDYSRSGARTCIAANYPSLHCP